MSRSVKMNRTSKYQRCIPCQAKLPVLLDMYMPSKTDILFNGAFPAFALLTRRREAHTGSSLRKPDRRSEKRAGQQEPG